MRTIILIILITMSNFKNSSFDLENFVVENEKLFWQLLSGFYPLNSDQINEYEKDLDFRILSENENAEITFELIDKFLDRWYIAGLLTNRSIDWKEETLKKYMFNNGFHWHYAIDGRKLTISNELFGRIKKELGPFEIEEVKDQDSVIVYNQRFKPAEQNLLEDYLRMSSFGYDNENLPGPIKKMANRKIADLSMRTILSLKEYINWNEITKCSDLAWTFNSINQVAQICIEQNDKNEFHTNEAVYKLLFKNQLNNKKLDELNKTLNHNQIRFYQLKSGKDKYGITSRASLRISNNIEIDSLLSIEKASGFLDTENSKPPRFSDYTTVSEMYGIPIVIVNDKLKAVLEQFNLPKHKFIKTKLDLKDRFYGNQIFNANTLVIEKLNYELIDYDKITLKNNHSLLKEELVDNNNMPKRIVNSAQFKEFRDSTIYGSYRGNLSLTEIPIINSYDLIALEKGEILVSENLREAIKSANISAISFEKDYYLRIKMKELKRNIRKDKIQEINNQTYESIDSQQFIIEHNQFNNRKLEILTKTTNVKEVYKKSGVNIENEITKKEIEFDVIFPDSYREKLEANNFEELEERYDDFSFYPLEDVQQVDREWDIRFPYTVKGVIVGEDVYYNKIGLLLKPDSSFELGEKFYFLGSNVYQIEY